MFGAKSCYNYFTPLEVYKMCKNSIYFSPGSLSSVLCTLIGNRQYGDLTLRRLMSYIYGAPILDVSRSHTTTQHSR